MNPHSLTIKSCRTLIFALMATSTALAAATNQTGATLAGLRQKFDLPALAVVVVKDGAICDRAAVGVRKLGDPTPVTTNDLFHIGSCTKAMTATLAAVLIEGGLLDWHTTIAEVFPELKEKMHPDYAAVTVEQLLRNRGGVPGTPPAAAWTRAWAERGTPREQRREFIAAILSQPPAAAPDTKNIYSNQGYAIVGAMLETRSGKAWEELITEKLFRPLGLNSAGFGPPGAKDKTDAPWGHARKLSAVVPQQTDNPPAIAPAGRVHCTLDDLARFAMLHLQEGKTDGLLKPETLARLHQTAAGDDYACGWVVLRRGWAGGTTLMHNGSNTYWYVVMWLAPKKNFAVIAATNIAGDDATKGCDAAAAAMIQQWLEK
jgi:CubicO group peptidase (beta-lactamase class C family)